MQQTPSAEASEGDPGGQEAHFTAAGAAQQSNSNVTGEKQTVNREQCMIIM